MFSGFSPLSSAGPPKLDVGTFGQQGRELLNPRDRNPNPSPHAEPDRLEQVLRRAPAPVTEMDRNRPYGPTGATARGGRHRPGRQHPFVHRRLGASFRGGMDDLRPCQAPGPRTKIPEPIGAELLRRFLGGRVALCLHRAVWIHAERADRLHERPWHLSCATDLPQAGHPAWPRSFERRRPRFSLRPHDPPPRAVAHDPDAAVPIDAEQRNPRPLEQGEGLRPGVAVIVLRREMATASSGWTSPSPCASVPLFGP